MSSVGWSLERIRQVILVQQDSVAYIKLIRKIWILGDLVKEMGRTDSEVYLGRVLILGDIRESLKTMVKPDRVTVHDENLTKVPEPGSVLIVGLDGCDRQDNIVVREKVHGCVGFGAGAGQQHGPHGRPRFSPLHQMRDH